MAARRPARESTSSTPAARRGELIVRTVATGGRITDLAPEHRRWFTPIETANRMVPGQPAAEPIRIPQKDADLLLKGLVRFVADLPAGTSSQVVWEDGRDELLVDTASIGITCRPGSVVLELLVGCDQLPGPRRVHVPFAVGRAESPRGLLMSTLDRVDAPAVVADHWSDAIVAFCWEALLELARRVSADAGVDRARLPLIPGAVAAEDRLLIVQPMARHDLGRLARP